MNDCKFVPSEEQRWERHPSIHGAQIAHLLTSGEDDGDLSCALVRLETGLEAEAHRHEGSDDVVYVLRGRGKMWVEGRGEIILREGTFLRIPRGCWHRPHAVEEELYLYNVWSPALR
jgi:quercetin dioxygenase-like cupin family protein